MTECNQRCATIIDVAAPSPPPRLPAGDRREALLDVTRALVHEVGPGGITMGVVADRATVTRALVYKHFANREDLLVALYRREAQRLDREIRARVAAAPDGFEPKLRALVGATLAAAEEHGPFFAPLRDARVDRDVRRDQRARDRRTVGFFAELAQRDFGIDERTARSVVTVLLSGIRSLLAQARSHPGAAEQRFLVETYVEMTIGGLQRLAGRNPP